MTVQHDADRVQPGRIAPEPPGIAAFFGALMNMSFLLAGTVSTNPVLFFAGILLILAWKNAGYIGIDRFLLPALGTPWKHAFVQATATMQTAACAMCIGCKGSPQEGACAWAHAPSALLSAAGVRGRTSREDRCDTVLKSEMRWAPC